MGVERTIDVTAGQRKTILTLLERHLPGTEAWVYGSRAKWTSRPQSDLDLVVFATPEQRRGVGNLREAFEESDLPFRVDLFVWDEVPETFREQIEAEHAVLAAALTPSTPTNSGMVGEWVESTLGEVADFLSGGTPAKSCAEYWGGSIPWVSAKDMKRFRIEDTEDHVSEVGVDSGTRLVPEGTVLLLARGMTLINDVPVCVAQRPVTFNQDVKALRAKPCVTPEFLPYLLLGNKQRLLSLVDLAGHGTGRLNSDELKGLDIVLPALPEEQRAIARILGTLDDKIELYRRMNETLEAMARALFKDWFVDFGPVRARVEGRTPYLAPEIWNLFPDSFDEDDQPVGWEPSELGDRVEVLDAKRIPLSSRERHKRQGPYPYHGAAGVMDYVDDYLFDGVHVLLGEDGSVVKPNGKPVTQYVWGKFWVNNHAHVLRGKGISNEMLLCFLEQIDITPYVTGAVQPKLNQKNLKSVPTPPTESKIVACFGAVIEPLFEQLRFCTEQSRTLRQTRDLLLPKLISGELRLPDAEKEVEAIA